MQQERTIFRQGSITYYWGTKFFPKPVRADVFRLYSFLRVADDYVDGVPPQYRQFKLLRSAWDRAIRDRHFDCIPSRNDTVNQRVIKNIVGLVRTQAFDQAWVEAFWDSMQADVEAKQYQTLNDSLWYVYGSAEVVGLMMAKLMHLPPEAYESAKMQGRAMQWINFIRDVAEDSARGRCYFPKTALAACGLSDVSKKIARAHPAAFTAFIRQEIDRYRHWQEAANKGLRYMPGLLQPGLKTAVDMYDWTARQIEQDPFMLFERQIKPHPARVVTRGVGNIFRVF